MNKALLLDRDGTIISDKNYLSDPELIEFLPGAIDALQMAKQAGYLLIVVTNQSGLARGYFTMDEARAVDSRFQHLLENYGVRPDGIYMCPHLKEGIVSPYNVACECRKPGLALFKQAIVDFNLNPSLCAACGDKPRDTERLTELGLKLESLGCIGTSCDSLYDFVQKLLFRIGEQI